VSDPGLIRTNHDVNAPGERSPEPSARRAPSLVATILATTVPILANFAVGLWVFVGCGLRDSGNRSVDAFCEGDPLLAPTMACLVIAGLGSLARLRKQPMLLWVTSGLGVVIACIYVVRVNSL